MFHVEHYNFKMNSIKKISGQILDVFQNKIFPGEIYVSRGKIIKIIEKSVAENLLITPGFIDSHIHIESSMLTPQNFAAEAVKHGTVGLICDPHEITNVLGLQGIEYMLKNSKKSKVKFFFGAPSCVPATEFENNGAKILPEDINSLFKRKLVCFLAEVMNYPGVINNDFEICEKIKIAKKFNKCIDGHAPGLKGQELEKYISKGISTDHECTDYPEAYEKIKMGMIIQIREGSAAKNLNNLYPLIKDFPEKIMLCTDDLHPHDLQKGHINILVEKLIKNNVNIFDAWKTASLNPVRHYNLNIGMLRINDPADFIVLENINTLKVLMTVINGNIVFEKGKYHYKEKKQFVINNFNAEKITSKDLSVPDLNLPVKIIKAYNSNIITKKCVDFPIRNSGMLISDIKKDYLKICVINRYNKEMPAKAFINGFKLKKGALASSISHDSHNIVAIGVDDNHITELVNWIIDKKGGIAIHDGSSVYGIPLPIAGIISDKTAETISKDYIKLNTIAEKIGCKFTDPFMTLSFMSLLVIPELKLSNKGLFDVNNFSFTKLYSE